MEMTETMMKPDKRICLPQARLPAEELLVPDPPSGAAEAGIRRERGSGPELQDLCLRKERAMYRILYREDPEGDIFEDPGMEASCRIGTGCQYRIEDGNGGGPDIIERGVTDDDNGNDGEPGSCGLYR